MFRLFALQVAELEVAVQEEFVFGLEDGAALADGLVRSYIC